MSEGCRAAFGRKSFYRRCEDRRLSLKILSWKTLSIILTVILIPFVISVLANITTWFGTRDRVEIMLKLNGWITVGSTFGTDLPNLKLTYNNKPVKNALKISWRITNTGSKGIEKFETNPAICFPKNLIVAESKVSQTSPLLKIDRKLGLNSENRVIEVKDIGVFNPGDFFTVDIYIIDMPALRITNNYFRDWTLTAKSVNLTIRKDITNETPRSKSRIPLKEIGTTYIVIALLYTICRVYPLFKSRFKCLL